MPELVFFPPFHRAFPTMARIFSTFHGRSARIFPTFHIGIAATGRRRMKKMRGVNRFYNILEYLYNARAPDIFECFTGSIHGEKKKNVTGSFPMSPEGTVIAMQEQERIIKAYKNDKGRNC